MYILSHGGWQERWKISLPSHGKPIWTTHAATCCSDLDSGNPLVVGDWTHLVMIHDGAKEKIYVDGVLATERDYSGDLAPTTQPLGIGYSPIDNDYFFKGALDELVIYDGALTDVDVADLYAEQSTPPVVAVSYTHLDVYKRQLLYHAYKETGDEEYLRAAEWSMEYLINLNSNPSYELQLPYGAYAAAKMNAELGTEYNIEKLLFWVFNLSLIHILLSKTKD